VLGDWVVFFLALLLVPVLLLEETSAEFDVSKQRKIWRT